ncbi:uncharacterized protein KD926_002723 [Aspergillus affinis]|uniref:uncharacterized protein n=1 Tax=Aspergillus affinis TaxID=1070780 RepID=UPI0022FEF6DC|nr:uncharacterized protein KD926_002723 [Aspergillus affinis]KAI9043833.1 hypothetical protein KD926_002723 [Aspergillus affinis]
MAPPSVPGDLPMNNNPGPRNIGLGLNRGYAADWTVQDALRELYQNWKDATLQTTPMDLLNFLPRVTVSPNEDEIIITVEQRPSPASSGDGPPT